ncbi:cellulase family glycosylhydrolase [Mucilaginibacter ginsenosidivorans]|uniref:Cellulase family glycosylhydrolase n=1 Tax=Mucilaginibacter ginsenosidivorans TaxID=398053 RepID=A0A5B8UT60_9SPHI|nr:cellulase family glycosylhydrolase [Mucilaginibacter ginsenosidivorans]QEC61571.1 cellulase family glycosylhydrolase [Mucilaginibacter ginsenosidivorans]
MKKMIKNTGTIYKIAAIFFVGLVAASCKKTESATPRLELANLTDTIPESGGTVALKFTTNAAWKVDTTGIGWLHLSQISGNSGAATINLTATGNSSGVSRSVLLNLNSTNGQSRRITVLQDANIYPSYNTSAPAPDAAGMSSTATQLTSNITMGYNIYNTMEAPNGETGWGNPVITQQLIDLIKQSGMNAVRIPIQYDNSHLINRATAQIDPAWLDRVKQVVQYCFNDNMYVMVNIHYDDGWLDCTATGAKQDTINAKQKAFWEQIATTLRDFDEHLTFASANEPNATDVPTTRTLMRYHQTFINAVRSTGGKNSYRSLIIQAPSTSLDLANQYLKPGNEYKVAQLPTDKAANKMIIEFHYYTPPNFCILSADASWGKEAYFWGANFHTTNPLFLDRNSTYNEERYVDSIFKTAKANFISKGIPMIMGEYGTSYHADKLTGYPADSLLSVNSQMHFYSYVTKQAKANGVLPFIWGSDAFNRQNNTVENQRTLDSLKKGAGL